MLKRLIGARFQLFVKKKEALDFNYEEKLFVKTTTRNNLDAINNSRQMTKRFINVLILKVKF